MTIWLTADEHYDHDQIRIYENRPFDTLRKMNRQLIYNHNNLVGEEDTVYHIGDFCMAREKKRVENVLKNLKGKHHLILGNHDYLHPFEYEDAGFLSIHSALDIGDILLIHDPAKTIVKKDRLWAVGHVHSLFLMVQHRVINVGVDVWNFKPVTLEHVLKLLSVSKGVEQTVAAKATS